MGEIRFVGTGETRGYPYQVCKKKNVGSRQTVKILTGSKQIKLYISILCFLHAKDALFGKVFKPRCICKQDSNKLRNHAFQAPCCALVFMFI